MNSLPSAFDAPSSALEQWAERWCASVEIEPRVIVTRGEGTHLVEIGHRFPSALILSWTDRESQREHRRVLEPSRDRLATVLIRALALGVEIYTANPPQALLEGSPTFADLDALSAELRSEARVEMGTTRLLGPLLLDNLAENIEDLLENTLSISRVHGLVADRPILVVGAGPSLGPFAKELVSWRERVFIIAATSALRPLQEVGITPDVAVIIEPRECLHHFEGISEDTLSNLTLAVESSTHPSHLRLPVARRIHFHGVAGQWLAPLSGEGSCVPSGGNVGTTMLVLAWMLGGWPVLIAGLDFAMQGNRYYTEKCGSRRVRVPEERTEAIAGWGHRRLRATSELVSYRRQSEQILGVIRRRDPKARFLMLTLEGARIEGVTPVDWRRLVPELPRLAPDMLSERLARIRSGIDWTGIAGVEKRFERYFNCLHEMEGDDAGIFEGYVLSRSKHKILEMLILPRILERRARGHFGEPTAADFDAARKWIRGMREQIRAYVGRRVTARVSSVP